MTLQKLPIGSQTFSDIIDQQAVYVDKTRYLYQLIAAQPINKYFLSRPRRFGKSLTLSTLEALFLGKRELFKDLWIERETDYDFPVFPVLRFDFSKIAHSNGLELKEALKCQLIRYANAYDIVLDEARPLLFIWEELVHQLTKNNKLVILIDEYDKPILDHITHLPLAKENRDALKGFYEIIKANDEHIRFVFITGITKFSQMNVFSGMNNLTDLTLDLKYADMLGYTQTELEVNFADHITAFAQAAALDRNALIEKIKSWYNGFRFTVNPVKVYNPFSTMMLLQQQQFLYHWFATGTPTYLMQLIQSEQVDVRHIEGEFLSIHSLESYNLDTFKVNFSSLLYQTGYLTVVDYVERKSAFQLGFPNLEVKMAFTEHLLAAESDYSGAPLTVADLRIALEDNNLDQAFHHLKLFFAKIPYDIQEPTEKYYQSLFYLIFTLIGTQIRAEVRTNKGRIDAVAETKTHVYLFEFKLNGTAQEALDQIENKDYAFGFSDSKKSIVKIGVAFSMQERNIVETKIN